MSGRERGAVTVVRSAVVRGAAVRSALMRGALVMLLFGACTADGGGDGGAGAASGREAVAGAQKADAGTMRVVTDVTAKDYVAPPLPRAKVIVHDVYGGKHLVDVEVAATEPMRTRGLMWREELPDGKGMLFVFPYEEEHGFWMRNTLIPLDMIYIDKGGVIVGIAANAEPRTLTSRGVGEPSKYVLEVPGGWSEKNGVSKGNRVEFHGLNLIDVR